VGSPQCFCPERRIRISGAVYFVPADRIRSSEVKLVAALNCMRRCGIGAAALLKDFSAVATAHS
jgi:hypothetical protein